MCLILSSNLRVGFRFVFLDCFEVLGRLLRLGGERA